MHSSVAPKASASATRRGELLARVLVGVGRAPALAEAAERAADDADVGDVDVAVDDERHRVARELGAQLVGGGAHVLDRLGPRLGEHRRDLLRRPAARRRGRGRSSAGAAPGCGPERRPEPRRGMKLQNFVLIDVEHALGDPLGVDVLAVDAQPLGQRDAVLGQALADLVRRGERVLGRDVVAVGAQAAEVGRARGDELGPPVGEVRRDLDADAGQQPLGLGDQALHVLDRRPASTTRGGRAAGPRRGRCASTPSRPPRRSRPAPARSSSGAGRSSGGSPPAGGRARRARRRAPRARRRARPRSRRCRRGSRS